MAGSVVIHYPTDPRELDDFWVYADMKGWATLVVSFDGRTYELALYELGRFQQEAGYELARQGWHLEDNVVLLREMTQDLVEGAVAALSDRGFVGCVPAAQ